VFKITRPDERGTHTTLSIAACTVPVATEGSPLIAEEEEGERGKKGGMEGEGAARRAPQFFMSAMAMLATLDIARPSALGM